MLKNIKINVKTWSGVLAIGEIVLRSIYVIHKYILLFFHYKGKFSVLI